MPPSPLFTALKEIGQFLGKKFDKLEKTLKSGTDKLNENQADQSRALKSLLSSIETQIRRMKEPTFSGEVRIDTTELAGEMNAIVDQLRTATDDISGKMPDITNIERALKLIYDKVDGFSDERIVSRIEQLTEAVKKLKKDGMDTVKLDDAQLKSLQASMGGGFGGGGGGIGGGTSAARRVTVANVALTNVNTEYSYTFPANTIKWTIKLRDQGTLGYYAYTSGKLPNSGDASAYVTIPQNFLLTEEGLEWSGKTIYLGAESASQVAEITSYQI